MLKLAEGLKMLNKLRYLDLNLFENELGEN